MQVSKGEGQRGRENLKQAPCPVQSPTWGSFPALWDHDLSQNQESDAHLTEPPGAPSGIFLFFFFLQKTFQFLFIFERERQTEREWGEGQRERETESETGSRL